MRYADARVTVWPGVSRQPRRSERVSQAACAMQQGRDMATQWRFACLVVAVGIGVVSNATAPAAALQQVLVARGSVWRYLDGGADPGAGWTGSAYSDTSWPQGAAQLGYGDGDEATVVSYGGNAAAKAITTYFRRTFTVSAAAAFRRLDVELLRDDGAVVYLNGVEILRDNMPSGPISATTLAQTAVGGSDESVYVAGTAGVGVLHDGVNVLAVEIHQSSPASSDISFDIGLTASDTGPTLTRGPYLQRGTPNGIVVRWRTDLPTDSVVRYGTAVGALSQSASSSTLATEHVVALSGVTADTRYVYSVGDSTGALPGGDASYGFTTSPGAGQAKRTRIWVIGDSGTGGSWARAVCDAYSAFDGGRSPDVWLMLGDNAYSSGTDAEYQVGVFDVYQTLLRSSVLWPTLGNHDGQSADSATQSGPYYDIFTLPSAAEAGGTASGTEAFYSFDYGRIHFVCLDSYESS